MGPHSIHCLMKRCTSSPEHLDHFIEGRRVLVHLVGSTGGCLEESAPILPDLLGHVPEQAFFTRRDLVLRCPLRPGLYQVTADLIVQVEELALRRRQR